MDDLLSAHLGWEEEDHEDTVQSSFEAEADLAAGRTRPAEEVYASLRLKHGLQDLIHERRLSVINALVLTKKAPISMERRDLNPHIGEAQPTNPEEQSSKTLDEMVSRVAEVLGNEDKALRWLGSPIRSLGFATPISLLGMLEGAQRVEDILTQMEHGVW